MSEPNAGPSLAYPLSGACEIARMGAVELAHAFRTRATSPVEATKAALTRADAINPKLNAFTFLDGERALEAARESERRWMAGTPASAMDGIPTTIKDIVWVKNWRVSYGSHTTPETSLLEDAPAVALMREAGLVFIGQTTTPEFGWKAVTDSPRFGITRNPYDERLTPGGSSGGAAVAAATGAGVFHLGTDGGGSIRIPAAFTGTVGMKPTFGRVPAYPASVFGTVAHIGPMARSVADAELMLDIMSGKDVRDWAQGVGRLEPLTPVRLDLHGARIGLWMATPTISVDDAITCRVLAAADVLRDAGAVVDEVELPPAEMQDMFHRHWFAGAAARLAAIPQHDREFVDPGFIDIARQGASFGAVDLVNAQNARAACGAGMEELLTRYDFLLSPATALLPFEAGREAPAGSECSRWTDWAGFSFPFNLSQQPALVLPGGITPAGLPVGIQLVAARGHEAKLFALGKILEVILNPSC